MYPSSWGVMAYSVWPYKWLYHARLATAPTVAATPAAVNLAGDWADDSAFDVVVLCMCARVS